tara:strand:+ start:39 stop:884 length:846 start_codon:yes stop_codon:yes gene_type:complete
MNNLQAINFANKILKVNKIKSHSLDSELILAKTLNSTRESLLINLNKKLKKKKFNKFKKLILRRKKNEPVAQILKSKEFWKYSFFIDENVLIPRPETEIIIEQFLKFTSKNSTKHILDVGTGSGCIIISILKERINCYGTALDISKKAINIAKYNAKMHHLQNKIKFINIDIDKFSHNKYDFIVSNPPYIKNFDIKRLEDSVRLFEPHLALNAGIDGLSIIKKLIIKSKLLLKKNGKIIIEIGENQKYTAMKLLQINGFYINNVCRDYQLYPRVLVATKSF